MTSQNGPLKGLRVLEIGSSVAGPFCGRLLADFGAEVIKVEPIEGDAVRSMSKRVNGRSLYAASIFRNKRLAAIDLRLEAGRDLARRMAVRSDIVVENFRPGTLEKWGMDYDTLARENPGLVLVRISGFGQSGPYRDRAGYGIIGEAVSGLRHLTGDPDRPPGRINTSLTDEVTGLYAAFGAVMAIVARQSSGRGQCVDATLYESAFSLIEPHVPAFDMLGIVAQRAGSKLPDSTPNNLYPTRDGRHIHITAMADGVFARLAAAIGKPELATDSRYSGAIARSANEDALDAMISDWTQGQDLADLEKVLEQAGVPASRIYDMEDIFRDPHYRARDMLLEVPDPELGPVTVAGVVPKLSATPGSVTHLGGAPGSDTISVLRDVLGLTLEQIRALANERAIFCAEATQGGLLTQSQGAR
jgi:crotonobetainyl-CoA:carnitine CoA-transferase CaiB-like acyl-CoA transferase